MIFYWHLNDFAKPQFNMLNHSAKIISFKISENNFFVLINVNWKDHVSKKCLSNIYMVQRNDSSYRKSFEDSDEM